MFFFSFQIVILLSGFDLLGLVIQLESWTPVGCCGDTLGRRRLIIQFAIAGRIVVFAAAQRRPARAGQHQVPHLADDGRRVVRLLQNRMFATRKNKNKIQINKRNTSIDLKEERWQSFFVLPTCTRINRPKQNRNSYVIQANDCRALFANCLVNKHMQRNLSAATLS